MKQLLVLSGKGGTGKTTVAASLITLAAAGTDATGMNVVCADCDVDAPNLHLIHGGHGLPETEDYYGFEKAAIHPELCTKCGLCETLCRFDAILDMKVNSLACEGCGVCEAFCPVMDAAGKKAIRLEKNISGITRLFHQGDWVFSTAELKMGNGASGKLVGKVRRNLYNAMDKQALVILDGSPGIGCPVIASVTGVDAVLIVTEPTLSGLHDMGRLVDVARQFGAECLVCINRYDLHPGYSDQISGYCDSLGIPLLARIPYDKAAIGAVNRGEPLVNVSDSPAAAVLRKLWVDLQNRLWPADHV
jgi:MinD superfamily P-loop ATPase